MTRPSTLARDDQVLAALRSCEQMGTTMEVASAMAGEGVHAQALYAVVYGSLCRLEKAGLVCRRRFEYNANTYWQVVFDSYDLAALEWAQSEGES